MHSQAHSISETSQCAYSHSRPPLLSISDHRNPRLPSIKNTNPLTVAPSVSVTVCIGQICANLPVASVFVFSLFLPLQIHIDIPRTNPLIPLFQQASVQEVRPPLPPHHLLPAAHTPPHLAGFSPFTFWQLIGGNIIGDTDNVGHLEKQAHTGVK